MKYIITLLLLVSSVSYAETNCKSIEGLAKSVMTARQLGASMSKVMGLLPKESYEPIKAVVIDAYSSPRFQVKANQERAIQDFANKYAVECYKL